MLTDDRAVVAHSAGDIQSLVAASPELPPNLA